MNIEKEVKTILTENEWKIADSDGSDKKMYFQKKLNESRKILISYTVKEITIGFYMFSLAECLENELSDLFNLIYKNENDSSRPINVKNFSCRFNNENLHEIVHDFENEIEMWGKSISKNATLVEFLNTRPDNNLIGQLWHITALAHYEKYEQLMDYQSCFQKGATLNFLPALTKDVIDRAVDYSIRNL